MPRRKKTDELAMQLAIRYPEVSREAMGRARTIYRTDRGLALKVEQGEISLADAYRQCQRSGDDRD